VGGVLLPWLIETEQSDEQISNCLEAPHRKGRIPLLSIGEGDDPLEISVQLCVGVDDVSTSAPIGAIVARPDEKELRLVGGAEKPAVDLSGPDVDDAAGDEANSFEVDFVIARATRAEDEKVEFESLVHAQLRVTASFDETGQRERLEREPCCVRLVRNRDDGCVLACRFSVGQQTDSDIPITVPRCLGRARSCYCWLLKGSCAADTPNRDRSLEMTKKIENAIALYMEGIRDGNAREAVTKYTGKRYTQHSTGVRDGVEGFVEFFEPFLSKNPERDIQVVRAIEDGNYVFVHVSQSLDGGDAKWITMDMFDTDDDDLIVEHWDVITEWVDETVSGHSQIDGPTQVEDLDKTEANRATVERFVNEILIGGGRNFTDFISTETYIQHNPQVGDGLEGFGAFVAGLAAQGKSMVYKYSYKVLAQGNFVVTYSLAQIGEEDFAVFDVFRIADGLIVEHWDAMEPLPRGEALVNQGKF